MSIIVEKSLFAIYSAMVPSVLNKADCVKATTDWPGDWQHLIHKSNNVSETNLPFLKHHNSNCLLVFVLKT